MADKSEKQANHDQPAPELLEILVCPVTKQPLSYDRKNNELISKAANLAFPVRNGIPIMLIEEAREIDHEKNTHTTK